MKNVAWRRARIRVFHDEFQIVLVSRYNTTRKAITTTTTAVAVMAAAAVMAMGTEMVVNVTTTRDSWWKQS
jgi:hypothetical protein